MTLKFSLIAILFGMQLWGTTQASNATDPTYNAGVVEFQISKNGTVKQRVKDNVRRAKELIESEQTRDLDIIVFPEQAISDIDWKTYVPDPAKNISPCVMPDYDYFMTQISCAARSRKLYVVINVIEKEYCAVPGYTDPCDPSGFNTYNTNVVFDRQGRVISRYRKTHLYRYEWYSVNVRSKPEVAIFETDFGVKFGHFICFDMLFYEPQQVLIRERNITDIIYPTYWFSELPFLTAIQLQEGYAFANDVNLLAAGANLPAEQNTGSGIYAGRLGRITATISEVPRTLLLKSKVPKHNRRADYQLPADNVTQSPPALETKRFTKLSLLRDYNLDIYATKLLDPNFNNVTETVSHGSFNCTFQIQRTFIANTDPDTQLSYRYRLVAFDGKGATHQSMDPSELAICALVACTGEELHTCGHIFPENVEVVNKYYFANITVRAAFRKAPRRNIMPSTVDGVMMPLSRSLFDWQEDENATFTNVAIKLNTPKADLLTFGIWANYYTTATARHNLDPSKLMRAGGESIMVSKFSLLFMVIAFLCTFMGRKI